MSFRGFPFLSFPYYFNNNYCINIGYILISTFFSNISNIVGIEISRENKILFSLYIFLIKICCSFKVPTLILDMRNVMHEFDDTMENRISPEETARAIAPLLHARRDIYLFESFFLRAENALRETDNF